MAYYETIFILDSLLTPEEIEKIIDRVKEIIEKSDGKILKIDKWGKRRLAYEIQKKQYGFYVSVEFDEKGSAPTILEHEYNYNDKILRYLTYRFDKKKIRVWDEENKQEQKSKRSTEKKVMEPIPEPEKEQDKEEVPNEE